MTLDKEQIRSIFAHLESGDTESFFKQVSPDVDWTVMGTHPLAGRYTSREEFRKKTLARIMPCLTTQLQLKIVNMFIDENTAIVELRALGEAKEGWEFDNSYCWICTFEDNRITKVRSYLDSQMVTQLIEEGEAPETFYR